jgi:hypothetical protein
MSYDNISAKTAKLRMALRAVLPSCTPDEALEALTEAIEELASAMADQEIDRLFNQGDFR